MTSSSYHIFHHFELIIFSFCHLEGDVMLPLKSSHFVIFSVESPLLQLVASERQAPRSWNWCVLELRASTVSQNSLYLNSLTLRLFNRSAKT